MPSTCHECQQPLPDTPDGEPALCPACAFRMAATATSETQAMPTPLPGLPQVEGHIILDELARGGMGVVYKARQLDPDREVALKMLLPLDDHRLDLRDRFRVEIRALAELDHPGILPLYQVGSTDGRPWFTMKLAAGGTLSSRLGRKHKPYEPRAAAALVAGMADAVFHAHTHGVLHRDIKPANILFDERGDPFLADFGLARLLDSTVHVTRSNAVIGTPCYIAPEVASRGAKEATTASDIYGLGAVLYELLSGRPPFMVEGYAALMKKIADDMPERPSTIASNVPRDLELISLTCLAKDPRQRYTSAKDLADDLRRWLNGEPIAARRASATVRLVAWARRRPAIAALSAALVLTVLVSTVWLTISGIQLRRALVSEKESRTRADEQSEFLIGEFADRLEKMGRLSLVEEACAKAAALDNPTDAAGHIRRARLLLRWASASWAKGDAAAATPRLREALSLAEPIADGAQGYAVAKALTIQIRCRLAEVLTDTASYAEATTLLDAAAGEAEKPGILGLDDALRLQAEIDRTRALIIRRFDADAAAAAPAARAAASFRAWQARKADDPGRTLALITALRLHGMALLKQRPPETAGALAIFREAKALAEPLARQTPPVAEAEFELAQCSGWIGAVLRRSGPEDSSEALAMLDQDREIMARLAAQDPLNWMWQFKLADAHHILAEYFENTGDTAREQTHRREREERIAAVMRQAPEVREWRLSFVNTAADAATAALQAGNKDEARRQFTAAIAAALPLVQRQPASRTEQDGWRNLNYMIAEAWLKAGDTVEAEAAYRKALELVHAEAAAGPAAAWWLWTAGSLHRRLAEVLKSTGNTTGALEANLKALECRATLLRQRWLRAVEDPAAVANSVGKVIESQLAANLPGDALQTAAAALDLYLHCRDIAGPADDWAKPIIKAITACRTPAGPHTAAACELARRAAASLFPAAADPKLNERDLACAAELEKLSAPTGP